MSLNIPEAELEEIVEDVLPDLDDMIPRQVCTVRTPRGRTGDIGYKTRKTQLNSATYGTDVPPNGDIQDQDIEYASFNYKAMKQVGKGKLAIEDQMDAEEYDLDAIEDATQEAVADAFASVLSKFDAFLSDTNTFTDYDSSKSGTWDDNGNSSEPYKTAAQMARDAEAEDLVAVAGDNTVEILRGHPDSKEEDSNYKGSGLASTQTVLDKIQDAHRNIRDVRVFGGLEDNGVEGGSVSVNRFFDNGFWIGSRGNTYMIDPRSEKNPETVTMETGKFGDVIMHAVFVDYRAPIQQWGQVIADVTT